MKRVCLLLLLSMTILLSVACSSALPSPDQLIVPVPLPDNTGKYMCPYTQDEVVSEWVDKAVVAAAGAKIGQFVGKEAGAKALEQIPFVGGWVGGKAGEAIGRKIAVEAAGGWEFIRATSDLSFVRVEDLAVFLYARYSTNEHYKNVMKATEGIYPDLPKKFRTAIFAAKKEEGGQ